jgi:hypothetical protein
VNDFEETLISRFLAQYKPMNMDDQLGVKKKKKSGDGFQLEK